MNLALGLGNGGAYRLLKAGVGEFDHGIVDLEGADGLGGFASDAAVNID